MPITFSPETTKKLQASIKRYAAEHLDEEMGDLKAGLGLQNTQSLLQSGC